jgi:serralysin
MIVHEPGVCGCSSCAYAAGPDEPPAAAAVAATKPVLALDQVLAKLMRWGAEWSPQPIDFSFYEARPSFRSGAEYNGYFAFSAEQRQAVRHAFELISDVANVSFAEKPDNQVEPGASNQRLSFGNSSTMPAHVTGWTLVDISETPVLGPQKQIYGAEIWFNPAMAVGTYAPGARMFMVTMHEVMHALGMPHPGDYNRSATEPILYQKHAEYMQDSLQYTVLSYFGAAETGAQHGGRFASTPLLHDVAVLQALYGPNLATRAGDTVYGYGSTAGRWQYDFSANTLPIIALWDGGGLDRLDFSGTGLAVNVDLAPGGFSDAFGMTRNIAIAHGATIEDARGGSGHDILSGNDAANALHGGGGADRLDGRFGNDRLFGEAGDDIAGGQDGDDFIDGGLGRDTLFGDGGADHMVGGSDGDGLFGQDGNDLIGGQDGDDFINGALGRDTLFGDAGADHIVGGAEADALRGQDGDDLIGGQDGDDFIDGALGRDTLFGDAGADHIVGGADGDALRGQDGDDLIGGQDGDDFIDGASGRDTLFGDAGADHIVGGSEDDGLFGQDGDDLIGGQDGADFIDGGPGMDRLYGDGGDDHVIGGAAADQLFGQAGDDLMGGQDGSDILGGGDGRDRLYGDAGDDTLYGDAGADQLAGGEGADTFAFTSLADSALGAQDRILDFRPDLGDRIDVSFIDANLLVPGDQAFALVNAFSGQAGQARLRHDPGADTTAFELDQNGDGLADLSVVLEGVFGQSGLVL